MSPTATTSATRETVEAFFRRLASRESEQIAELFSDPVDWFIPGNEALAPWLGRCGTRDDVAGFFRLLFANVEPLRAEVQQVLVDGETAIATGEFASRMLATGKVIESMFFTHFTVRDRQIVRYRLLEDSHAVAVALTP